MLRWVKAQGAYAGYAHSGSGLQVNPSVAAKRLVTELDADKDGLVSRSEAARGLLPEKFDLADTGGDGSLSESDLMNSVNRAADQLPNLAIPELNSVGAQEIFVTTALGLCDFISAMDTARLLEWNCWYHLLNCAFLESERETDFMHGSTRWGRAAFTFSLAGLNGSISVRGARDWRKAGPTSPTATRTRWSFQSTAKSRVLKSRWPGPVRS